MINQNYLNRILSSELSSTVIPAEIQLQWYQYISLKANPQNYSYSDKSRVALAADVYRREQLEGRTLFHMSITYKPYSDREYAERDVNNFFKHFYTRGFLPYVMNTKNYHTNAKKAIQPICFCFVDEHESRAVSKTTYDANAHKEVTESKFPVRLHHHAILAVHPDTLEQMNKLVGTNTLVNGNTLDGYIFSPKIMTSSIKQCEPQRILYSSKMYYKYPDFMTFPDSFTRHHVRS